MTRQILHKVIYEGEENYLLRERTLGWLISKTFPVLSLPRNACSSAGDEFFQFEIENGLLYLTEMRILGLSDPTHMIAGVSPREEFWQRRISRTERKRTGETAKEKIEPSGWFKYAPLHELIPYTGCMIIGNKYQKELPYLVWFEMYYHACGSLKRLTFENGKLTQIEDFAKESARIRAEIPDLLPRTPAEKQLWNDFMDKVGCNDR